MRVALADDAVLFREGIARVLGERGFEVVAQVGNADDLLNVVETLTPDVIVVDIRMPPTNTHEGLLAALQIRVTHPEIGVLVLSQYIETHYAMQLLGDRPEGAGYLLKDRVSHLSDFTEAVTRVASGGSVIDPRYRPRCRRRRRCKHGDARCSDPACERCGYRWHASRSRRRHTSGSGGGTRPGR